MGTTASASFGGCHCGDIRFRAVGKPVLIEYCHCESCRNTVGAPLLAWGAIPIHGFEITKGDPVAYNSSENVVRSFCGRCETSLTLADQQFTDETYVSVEACDEPDVIPPEFHIWGSHRLLWLETLDTLPRYVRFKYEDDLED